MSDTTGLTRDVRSGRVHTRADFGERASGEVAPRDEGVRMAELGPGHALLVVRLRGSGGSCELRLGAGTPRDPRIPAAAVDGHRLHARRNGVPHHVVVGVLPVPAAGGIPDSVTVREESFRRTFPSEALEAGSTDLRTLLREELAGLDAGARTRLVAFVAEAVEADPDAGALTLARDLALVRDALREPAAERPREPDAPCGIHVDAIHAIDERGFWIRGWLMDRDAPVTRLTAIAPEGYRAELLPDLYRYPRGDLNAVFGSRPPGLDDREEAGFVAYVELSGASRLAEGWILEMEDAIGTRTETAAPAVVVDGLEVRDAVLRDLTLEEPGEDELKTRHARRALEQLQRRLVGAARIARVRDHGAVPEDPAVSIIVPLYRRLDFLEQQLAHFVHDPELREVELIYVLDSPGQSEELTALAPALHELYRVPFRVVYLEHNLGFSGANNAGVAYARGDRLLFLNSDIIPAASGWVGRLIEAYDATPGVGTVGPKLLYEDDSLQHAGLYFRRQPSTGEWENAHYYKGLHRALPAAGVSRHVPAVSGACLLIDAELYRELGGFRGMYVQGDYEDSDLCLRVLETGRSNWYAADVELYHLEGQSYPDGMRRSASAYNRWLHTYLWGGTIESIMGERAFHELGATAEEAP